MIISRAGAELYTLVYQVCHVVVAATGRVGVVAG